MAKLSRREFLFLGVATGATAAVGIVVPVALNAPERAAELPKTDDIEPPPTQPPPLGVVGLFPRLQVGTISGLDEGRPSLFDYPLVGQSNLLVKLGTGATGGVGPDRDIVAFSNICTHMGCVIPEFGPKRRVLGPCPCHFSTFDLTRSGMVTLGQATQNLPQVILDIAEDDIYATGVLRLVYGFHNTLEGAPLVGATR